MNVYDAIMKAADQIERYPETFDFGASRIPFTFEGTLQARMLGKNCPVGCALGWIGHFIGRPKALDELNWDYAEAASLLGIEAPRMRATSLFDQCDVGVFYSRMSALSAELELLLLSWQYDARTCACCLRAYAAKYHAPVEPIPSSIREIFTCPTTPSETPSNPESQTIGSETSLTES